MERRKFLIGSSGSLTAAVLPPFSFKTRPGPDYTALAKDLLHRRDRVAERTLRRLGAHKPDEIQLAYARSAGAMAAIDRLSLLPIRDQVHSSIQALMGELFTNVGEGLLAVEKLFDTITTKAPEPDPDALKSLFAGSRKVVLEEDLTEASKALYKNGLAILVEELDQEGFHPRLRREARRIRRLASLSERIAKDGLDTAVLTPADPKLKAEVEAAQQEMGDSAKVPKGHTALQVLGLIGCGLGIIVGGYYIVMGIACAISCDAPGALIIAILAAVIMAASIWGIILIQRAVSGHRPKEKLDNRAEPDLQ